MIGSKDPPLGCHPHLLLNHLVRAQQLQTLPGEIGRHKRIAGGRPFGIASSKPEIAPNQRKGVIWHNAFVHVAMQHRLIGKG